MGQGHAQIVGAQAVEVAGDLQQGLQGSGLDAAGDFERCAMFFKAVPQARAELDKMLERGPYWAALVPIWGALENYRQYGENASIRDAIHDAVEPVRNKLDAEQAQATELVDDDPRHPAGPLSVRVRRG